MGQQLIPEEADSEDTQENTGKEHVTDEVALQGSHVIRTFIRR